MKNNRTVRMIAIFLAMSFGGNVFAASNESNKVPADNWVYKALSELEDVGIIDKQNNTFSNNKLMTRSEIANLVEKAMDNSSKATMKQKMLINKLGCEFALEINNIAMENNNVGDSNIDKVEKSVKPTLRVGFDTLMMFGVDSPSSGQPGVNGNDRTKVRYRLTFDGALNDKTDYTARLTTAVNNAGMNYNSSSQFNTITIDKGYFTSKNVLGFDRILWGRQGIDELGGNVLHSGGGSDGIALVKKLSPVTTIKGAWYDIKMDTTNITSGTSTTHNAQDIRYLSTESQVNKNLILNGLLINNDSDTSSTYMGRSYSYNGSRVEGISAQYKMGRYTVLGEYDWAQLDGAVGLGDNPRGYAVQITTGKKSTNRFLPIPQTFTDINKPGDNAFTVTYHSNDAGLIPSKLGPWNGIVMYSPNYMVNGKAVSSAQDGVKGWAIDYQYVVAKGVECDLMYQNLKFVNQNTPFDKTYMFIINTRF